MVTAEEKMLIKLKKPPMPTYTYERFLYLLKPHLFHSSSFCTPPQIYDELLFEVLNFLNSKYRIYTFAMAIYSNLYNHVSMDVIRIIYDYM